MTQYIDDLEDDIDIQDEWDADNPFDADELDAAISRLAANSLPFTPGPISKVYCPTGKGGGVDPTCSPGGMPSSDTAYAARILQTLHGKVALTNEGNWYPKVSGPVKFGDLPFTAGGSGSTESNMQADYNKAVYKALFFEILKDRHGPEAAARIERATELMFERWKSSSSNDTSKQIMVFLHDIYGVPLRRDGLHAITDSVEERIRSGGLDPVLNPQHTSDKINGLKATYEVSQLALKDTPELRLYRGVNIGVTDDDYGPGDAIDVELEKSTLQSMTPLPNVAYSFGKTIIRANVPREAVLSIPASGDNAHNEEEYIVLGTDWGGWDVINAGYEFPTDDVMRQLEDSPIRKRK